MRYDNWDIILFPEESNIPIQEYKTACYFSRDEDGRELPTLRTYIGSLKPEKPFRISVHHWGSPKPSPLIQEAQRRVGKKITFTVQVVIEGVRVYHGVFEVNTTSPQEIAYEQRSFKSSKSNEPPTSLPKQRLRFPQNNEQALLQSSAWQPRGTDNRIKILLSERLVDKHDEFITDIVNDIVCFSFQHAPRELLEQAGVAYPIIDPLRSIIGERATFASRSLPRNSIARELQQGTRVHVELSSDSDTEPTRHANLEPHQRSDTRLPSTSNFPSFMLHRGGGHPGIWHNPYGPLGEPDDDLSMDTWKSRRGTSNMSGMQYLYDPSFPPYMVPPWPQNTALPEQRSGPKSNSRRSRNDKSLQQVQTSLRDDQFGQLVGATSPPKKHRDLSYGLPAHCADQDVRPPTTQHHRPPKMGTLSVPVRPSSAAIARTTSYPDFNAALRNSSKRPSTEHSNPDRIAPTKTISDTTYHVASKKENHDILQSSMATSHSFASRVPTPNPFFFERQRWDSDVSMRDGSSNFSSISRCEQDSAPPISLANKAGSAHAPSAAGNVRSRKEGLATAPSDVSDIEVHHDQSLLPPRNGDLKTNAESTADDPDRTPRNGPNGVLNQVEVIDVDAIDPGLAEATAELTKLSPFKPSHTAGMSSISSTGRLERQLFSALGEELGSFGQQMNTTGMSPELVQALSSPAAHNGLSGITLDPTVSAFEPVTKRKRQGTLGGDRDKSPTKKKERGRQAMDEDGDIPEDMPRLRGD